MSLKDHELTVARIMLVLIMSIERKATILVCLTDFYVMILFRKSISMYFAKISLIYEVEI